MPLRLCHDALVFQECLRCPEDGKKIAKDYPLSPDRTGDIRRSCFELGSGDYNATLFQLSYERNWMIGNCITRYNSKQKGVIVIVTSFCMLSPG
jgi:hypothetical protein